MDRQLKQTETEKLAKELRHNPELAYEIRPDGTTQKEWLSWDHAMRMLYLRLKIVEERFGEV